MDKKERDAYYGYLNHVMIHNDNFETARIKGRAEGFAEGKAKGCEKY